MKYKNMIIVPSNPRRIRSFSPQNAAIPPLEMRDSIRSKVLGRGGVGLGGEEKPFYSFKRFATHAGRARYSARRGRHQPGV